MFGLLNYDARVGFIGRPPGVSIVSSYAFWLTVGFVGQGLFTARLLVQWLASEKERAVVVPSAFWWLSLAGGAALLSYAVQRRDPVIVVGQSVGLFVYARNLALDAGKRSRGAGAASGFNLPAPHFRDDRDEGRASVAAGESPGDAAGVGCSSRLRM